MSRVLLFGLYLLIFFAVFNFTAGLMAGPYIASALGGANTIASYNVSFFGLGNACSLPLSSYLGNRFGSFKVLIIFCSLFFICTLLCAFASTFFLFVLMRFFSGVVSGNFFSISFQLINQDLTPEKKESSFAFLSTVTTILPVIGASYGGWIAYDYNWTWIFYAQLPLIALAIGILFLYKPSHTPLDVKPFDFTGYSSYLLAICSIVTVVTVGQELDWFRSPFIWFASILGVVSLGFFLLWEWGCEFPVLNIRLFKYPTFSLCVFCIFFLFGSYFGMIILLTLWLHLVANYTPIWIAILLLHMLIAGAILYISMWKYFKHTNSFAVVSLSIIFFIIACNYSSTFNVMIDFKRLAIARSLMGTGLAFFFFPLIFLSIEALPEKDQGMGLSIFQSVRLVGGALGISFYSTMLLRRTVFYHERLGEQLSSSSQLTSQFFQNLLPYSSSSLESDLLLENALSNQSSSLALADCYYFMQWLMIFTLAVVLISRRKQIANWIKNKKIAVE